MEQLAIYGCYAEGYVFKGFAELKAVELCSSVYDIVEAYASIGININNAKPIILDFDDEGFAPGFEVEGVTYIHFKAGNVFNNVLVREA